MEEREIFKKNVTLVSLEGAWCLFPTKAESTNGCDFTHKAEQIPHNILRMSWLRDNLLHICRQNFRAASALHANQPHTKLSKIKPLVFRPLLLASVKLFKPTENSELLAPSTPPKLSVHAAFTIENFRPQTLLKSGLNSPLASHLVLQHKRTIYPPKFRS